MEKGIVNEYLICPFFERTAVGLRPKIISLKLQYPITLRACPVYLPVHWSLLVDECSQGAYTVMWRPLVPCIFYTSWRITYVQLFWTVSSWTRYVQSLTIKLFSLEVNLWNLRDYPCGWLMHMSIITYLFTYSMEQSPSWEVNRFSTSQEIPCILWNLKVHCLTHKCPSPLSLSWASSIQFTPPHHTSWRSILILSTHLRLCLPSSLFPSGFRMGIRSRNESWSYSAKWFEW
jgi:hypothetical protein